MPPTVSPTKGGFWAGAASCHPSVLPGAPSSPSLFLGGQRHCSVSQVMGGQLGMRVAAASGFQGTEHMGQRSGLRPLCTDLPPRGQRTLTLALGPGWRHHMRKRCAGEGDLCLLRLTQCLDDSLQLYSQTSLADWQGCRLRPGRDPTPSLLALPTHFMAMVGVLHQWALISSSAKWACRLLPDPGHGTWDSAHQWLQCL